MQLGVTIKAPIKNFEMAQRAMAEAGGSITFRGETVYFKFPQCVAHMEYQRILREMKRQARGVGATGEA